MGGGFDFWVLSVEHVFNVNEFDLQKIKFFVFSLISNNKETKGVYRKVIDGK